MENEKDEELELIRRVVGAMESFADSFRRYVELHEQTAEATRKALESQAELAIAMKNDI